jgi:hypothetical protein
MRTTAEMVNGVDIALSDERPLAPCTRRSGGDAGGAEIADQAPTADELTDYDLGHLATYLRLLDADAEGADWREVARGVLRIDPDHEPARARAAWESHLARARWMTERGYQHLLRCAGSVEGGGPPLIPTRIIH